MPTRPAPDLDGVSTFLWEAAGRGELRFQRCTACGVIRHPPSLVCASCASTEWDSICSNGRGVIYSYVIPRKPALPFLDDGTVFVIVELADGVRFVSDLIGVSDVADVEIGAEVEVDFLDAGNGLGLPVFRLAGAR